jgi:hypothetical protein
MHGDQIGENNSSSKQELEHWRSEIKEALLSKIIHVAVAVNVSQSNTRPALPVSILAVMDTESICLLGTSCAHWSILRKTRAFPTKPSTHAQLPSACLHSTGRSKWHHVPLGNKEKSHQGASN